MCIIRNGWHWFIFFRNSVWAIGWGIPPNARKNVEDCLAWQTKRLKR